MKKIKSIILGILLMASILTVINPVSAATITVNPGDSIQTAIGAAAAGDTIIIMPGIYNENIVINKALTLQGSDKATTIIKPAANATNWFLLQASNVHIKNLTLDGTGYNIRSAFRTEGGGSITNCIIKNIRYTQYEGWGLSFNYAVSMQDWQIAGNEFRNIQRVGILVDGQGNKATISKNIFEGTGKGDWVQYGVEVGDGAIAYIDGNTISNYTGVASSDGSESAGILVTSYFGPNPKAYVTNNTIASNTTGVYVGYLEGDTSYVTVKYNILCNNGEDIINVKGTTLEASGNRGCPKDLPMKRILGILKKNSDKDQQE